ncbi:hypothetical protein HZH66_009107 [Vespula vulgaris]|uniref:UBX domain-containing protein 11 n=2 Tax=Vespula TaxID=7451 RepID=A0A834N353_VESVU|nr:hypothetical protein HZH66_009107 [Vespula vulgaris]
MIMRLDQWNRTLLKKVTSNSSYVLSGTDNERLDNGNIDKSQRPKIVSNPGTSWADTNKTNSGACFSGRRLWMNNNKILERSSNVPIHVNNTIEEESEFISIVTKQLYLAESQMHKMQNLLSKAEERLHDKDQEIERFKRKVKDLETKCKNQETLRKKEYQQRTNQTDNSGYLYKRCLILEHKIFEMEKFLADYGLIWVGDNGTSTLNKEYSINNFIESCYEQLIANIDRLNVAAGKGEVHVHHNEKGSGASFKTLSCMSLKFYKNGMLVQDSPLRLYNDPRTTSFIRDILDGYFPSELQEAYPNGVPFKVEDHRSEVYTNNVNVFPGHGYRLGKQTSKDGSSSIRLRNSKTSSNSSRQCSPRVKESPCNIDFASSFATRSLKSKNSPDSQSVDILSLRSQILASHNNVCSDSHLQSHINAELALSSRKEKRDLATKNIEYDLLVRERNSKLRNVSRFPSSGRNYPHHCNDRSSSKLSPIRLEKMNDRSRTRSRSASISNLRFSRSNISKSKSLSEDESKMSGKSSESESPRNPRISKSATHASKPAPPILHQINEPSGKSGELRLKVRSLNGGTVYLVHLSADDFIAKLYELLNEALPATWHKGYKILVSGYSPKRLEELELSLRESGITRDSVLHLVKDGLTSKSNDLENERNSVKDALDIEASNKFTRLMATFVPNEIILAKDLNKKIKDQFDAILLFIDISDLTNRYNTFRNAENGGMYAFTILLNKYFNVIISEIYTVEGDVFKISQDTILSLWRIHQGELILNIMPKVINCAFNVKNAVMAIEENAEFKLKMNIVISAGNVIFSILGNELSRHYVIAGQPLLDFKKAQDISLPGDLILSTKAWEYCTPSKYEYVIKDAHNIKTIICSNFFQIIKILKYNKKLKPRRTTIRPLITNNSNHWDPAMLQKLSELLMKTTMDSTEESTSSEEDQDQEMFSPRTSMLEAIKRNIGIQLKIYLIHTVTQQIALNQPLEYLMETRRVTIIYIDIIPSNSNTLEFIYLMDECYLLLHSIIRPFSACMYLMNMYESNILFSIVFGLKELIGTITNNEKMTQNAITCAFKILHALKNNLDIRGVSIGVSTGMAYCGVVGHNTRKEYMIIGTPLTYAKGMMEISYDKISCDYDTIIHSNLSRTAFKSRGIHEIKKIGKCHVYEFLGIPSIQLPPVKTSNLYYRYPILGRSEELEVFNDILDNIGVMDRNYSGILIMGDERSGKSRLLDAYVSIAKNRQINVIQLPLHYSYSEKEFTVIYYIILLILNAEDCKCIKDRERILKKKLSSFLPSNEFCYLNTLMKVSFPLSNEYCAADHSQRYVKMREIFNLILNQVCDAYN